jgi:large conductance mechanosensitive channel
VLRRLADEFKQFAIKGNVVDMAVGIIIGAAFTTMVKSLVDDLLMPPISLLTGGLDFSNQFLVLKAGAETPEPYHTLAEAKKAGATVFAWGLFANTVVSFSIVSMVLFFVVRWINRLRSSEAPPPPMTKSCPFCVSVIHKDAKRCPSCTSALAPD